MLPPAPETPLQLIKCSCSMSVCETSRCKYKVNHLYCTNLCCCGAEEDSCKKLPVVNMLMTFEQLFSFACGIRCSLSRINKNALLSDFDLKTILPISMRRKNQIVTVLAVLSKYNG